MVTQILKTSLLMKQEETLILRESDKGNQIQFIFNDLTSITSAEFRLIKPDETFVISTGEIDTENNIITFDIIEQCCTVPGKGRFNIRLIGTDINVYTYVGRCIIDINLDLENAVESTAEANGYTFPDDFLPSADLSNYATSPHKVGRKWIDGKDIWEVTIEVTFTSEYANVDLTDLGIDFIIPKVEGGFYDSNGGMVPIDYENSVSIYMSSVTVMNVTNRFYSNRPKGYVTIYYTI